MAVRRLLSATWRRPELARYSGPLWIELRDRARPTPVLIYQMGKVASSALAHEIEAVSDAPAYHQHVLSDAGIRFVENVYRQSWDVDRLPIHLWESRRVRRLLRSPAHRPWTVITVTRDPVARNVSAFFQIADLQFGIDPVNTEIDELRTRFLEQFDEHDRPLRWFDEELDGVFDTRTFAEEFPHEQGWTTIESDLARVGVIRYEDLQTATRPLLRRLLEVDVAALGDQNRSSTKKYADAMSGFREGLILPDDYLDWMYNSKYARHFYTDAEREAYRRRWRGEATR
jgi:hypothetical protein